MIETDEAVGFQASAQAGAVNLEETIMPYLTVLSKFRDDIRTEARANKASGILKICDELRDNVLPDLGVLIEDLADKTVVKLCDRETLIKEREQKLLVNTIYRVLRIRHLDIIKLICFLLVLLDG